MSSRRTRNPVDEDLRRIVARTGAGLVFAILPLLTLGLYAGAWLEFVDASVATFNAALLLAATLMIAVCASVASDKRRYVVLPAPVQADQTPVSVQRGLEDPRPDSPPPKPVD